MLLHNLQTEIKMPTSRVNIYYATVFNKYPHNQAMFSVK